MMGFSIVFGVGPRPVVGGPGPSGSLVFAGSEESGFLGFDGSEQTGNFVEEQ